MSIKFRDAMSMRGCFKLRVYRGGKLIETYEDHNLIVNGARNAASRLIAGMGESKHIAKIAFDVSGNIPTPSDTAISGVFIKQLSGVTFPATGQAEFAWTLLGPEANGMQIIEFGLLTEDETLWARKVRAEAIPKGPDIAFEGEWVINH